MGGDLPKKVLMVIPAYFCSKEENVIANMMDACSNDTQWNWNFIECELDYNTYNNDNNGSYIYKVKTGKESMLEW